MTVPGRWVVMAIVAFSAIMVGIAAVMLFGHPRGKIAPPPSIAVLPVIGDSSGAVTTEIIDALKPISGLQVADAALFASNRTDTRAIGEKLNVRTVLDASVEGTHVKITLLNGADSFVLWTHIYDRDANFKANLARDVEAHVTLK